MKRFFFADFNELVSSIIDSAEKEVGKALSEEYKTLIICAVLIAAVAAIIVSMVRNKKKGKPSCGCGCVQCPMSGSCHPKE